ncbi:MAG: Cell shape determining protein, MreB/Mrl family [Candidatus Jorgensenbacteria bacterium GW2011_GWA1_48_13]|uniref:Cell shape-determining protein MreB n=1 Tax=Candidatus Jorgensenbacteria bacterium GW2011_GWB1_50_10 TaxID=1618665 RepID=A0A0G1WA42_9BACT|nr:MAG: Cell shape determining protein, MreB/Mrl family [Candidatus Jorgensenbacteria bacterium GW2011_GWA1_48_13]KKW15490.1 MAG: Cell shape determining protein, MreB/Mrl family [Candidatus Jorgensenbacteria bacterium GW2011_GWB1_50_10]
MFVRKIGIDLGTTNTLVFLPDKGIVINEPTVVALRRPDNGVLAVGAEAKEMVGRTPDNIVTYKPLKDGVIAEYYITQAMLKYFIAKSIGPFNVFRPEVVISVPAGITSTEYRAVMNAAREAGAREVYLVKEPLLASLGAGIPIHSSEGNMIVNIGGGTTEVAIISLGGIVAWASRRVAGNRFDQAVSEYIKKKYGLAIGESTAENIKIAVGSALPNRTKLEAKIRGRDLLSGLPRDLVVNSNEVAEAINPYLIEIMDAVQSVFNVTPPELAADIMEKGIILSGGSAQLRNLDEFFKRSLGVAAYIAEDPFFCVARGTATILNHLDVYKRTLLTKR